MMFVSRKKREDNEHMREKLFDGLSMECYKEFPLACSETASVFLALGDEFSKLSITVLFDNGEPFINARTE